MISPPPIGVVVSIVVERGCDGEVCVRSCARERVGGAEMPVYVLKF